MAHHHAPSSSSWKPSSLGRYEGLSPTSSSSNGGVGGGGARAKSHEQLVGMVVSGGSPRGGGEHQQVQPWEEDDVALRQEAWGEVLAQQQKQSEQWQATLARQAELSQYWEEQLRNQVLPTILQKGTIRLMRAYYNISFFFRIYLFFFLDFFLFCT